MLSNELKELYSNYYQNGVKTKRILSARDSVREISKVTDGKKFNKVLDVGSGDGSVLLEIDRMDIANELSVVEISESGIEIIKELNLSVIKEVRNFDGYSIPFEDNDFDLAISTYVLEHVEHERLFLREMARVAKYVLISVPLENTRLIRNAVAAGKAIGHINFYNIETFGSLLDTCGLDVVKIYPYTTSLEYEKLCSPKFGWYKYQIRKFVLKTLPKIAQRNFTYMGIAICKVREN